MQIDKLRVEGGQVGWTDQVTQPAAEITATDLAFEATAVQWPMEQPARFTASAEVAGAVLQLTGEATDQQATMQAEVNALPLVLARPYLAQQLEPVVDGKLSAQLAVEWKRPVLKIRAKRAAIDAPGLTLGKTSLASMDRVELRDAEADLAARTLSIGAIVATGPKAQVERGSDKRWMYERWLKTPAADMAAAAAGAAGEPAKPWTLAIGSVDVDGGALGYVDKAADPPVEFELSDLKVSMQQLSPGSATASPLQ